MWIGTCLTEAAWQLACTATAYCTVAEAGGGYSGLYRCGGGVGCGHHVFGHIRIFKVTGIFRYTTISAELGHTQDNVLTFLSVFSPENTPGTGDGPGFRDRTLAIKSRKTPENQLL